MTHTAYATLDDIALRALITAGWRVWSPSRGLRVLPQ